ncbi:hypothetical protein U9M48_007123 [Paspalum notatum var. saurae]|uniref:Uncharacterized protein n=1 Tax=Paspalum notatum var. saurae TaxID=547442 RepID=A0AAQ3SK19_PASNO
MGWGFRPLRAAPAASPRRPPDGQICGGRRAGSRSAGKRAGRGPHREPLRVGPSRRRLPLPRGSSLASPDACLGGAPGAGARWRGVVWLAGGAASPGARRCCHSAVVLDALWAQRSGWGGAAIAPSPPLRPPSLAPRLRAGFNEADSRLRCYTQRTTDLRLHAMCLFVLTTGALTHWLLLDVDAILSRSTIS